MFENRQYVSSVLISVYLHKYNYCIIIGVQAWVPNVIVYKVSKIKGKHLTRGLCYDEQIAISVVRTDECDNDT